MPELDTIEIHSLKDPSDKWIINAVDYNSSIHTKWGEAATEEVDMVGSEPSDEKKDDDEETLQLDEQHESSVTPSNTDFVQDDTTGEIYVNIINPHNQRARLQIPESEYDPDEHRLWSTHPRFQK